MLISELEVIAMRDFPRPKDAIQSYYKIDVYQLKQMHETFSKLVAVAKAADKLKGSDLVCLRDLDKAMSELLDESM